MFTGLVEEMGRVADRRGGRMRFEARAVLVGTGPGASIAVDGCCLTAVEVGDGWWSADVVAETMSRTTLGRLAPGDVVNLERPVPVAGRLDGHIVQGHVDGVGRVVRAAPDLEVRVDPPLARYLAAKGSVAVDGCSLTVVEAGHDTFTVAVIPHTAEVTTLGRRRPGDPVNIEVDVLAKYVERLIGASR